MLNRFLKQFFIFSFILFSGILVTVVLSKFIIASFFDYRLNSKVNILILGDSHTQCGLDDSVIRNSLNLSESADTYFYSYVKLKKVLSHNKQIDTLILGYASHNISKSQDQWLKSSNINSFKLPIHFFLFDNRDFNNFVNFAPSVFFENIPKIIKTNITHGIRIVKQEPINKFGIGGYLSLDKKLDRVSVPDKKTPSSNLEYSIIDINFLKEIYTLCSKNKIKLILINTPVYKSEKKAVSKLDYILFASKMFKKATLIDYSKLSLDKKYFADETHLNNAGSSIFSEILAKDLKR